MGADPRYRTGVFVPSVPDIYRYRRRIMLMMVGFLALTMFGVGLYSSTRLQALDDRYSRLVADNLRAIDLVRDVSRNAAEAHRALINLVVDRSLAEDPDPGPHADEPRRQRERMAAMTVENDRRLAQLEALVTEPAILGTLHEMASHRKTYLEHAARLTELLDQEGIAEADRFRIGVVRPAYDAYAATQDRLADAVLDRALRTSAELSAATRRWRWISLGASSWPVVVAVLGLIGMVGAMLWITRSLNDDPVH